MLAQKCQGFFSFEYVWWSLFGFDELTSLAPLQVPAETHSSLRGWTESARVQFKMPNQSRRCEFVWVSRSGSDKSSTQGQVHKRQELLKCLRSRVFQTGLECIGRIVATSAGASVQFELNGECTFIFQSNNQMTSPFSEPMLSGGGRPRSQMQAVMHLRPIYCSDVLLPCDEGSPLLFAKLWSVSIQIKIMHRDRSRCAEAHNWTDTNEQCDRAWDVIVHTM